MRLYLLVLFVFTFPFCGAHGEEYCGEGESQYNNGIDSSRCITAGAAAFVAGGAGVYAAKRYGASRSIENTNTVSVFDSPHISDQKNGSVLLPAANKIGEGDKVTFSYQLSEEDNRQHHIDLKEAEARSAEASARSYDLQSQTAMKWVQEYDEKGRVISQWQEPDHVARLTYATMAYSSEKDAERFWREADDARDGGLVPTYDFEKVVASKSGTQREVGEFIGKHLRSKGSIQRITSLPAKHFEAATAQLKKGHWGVGGAVLALGVLAEELTLGAGAELLRDSRLFNQDPEQRVRYQTGSYESVR
jgi:hypothetical protein